MALYRTLPDFPNSDVIPDGTARYPHFTPTMLVALLLCLYSTAWAEVAFNPLGRGIYLPRHNLLGNLQESGSQVLDPSKLQNCTFVKKAFLTSKTFKFYNGTKELYKHMTTTAGLHASLQADFTLKFTRESVSSTINSAMVASGFLDIMAETGQTFLDKHCIQKVRFLDQNFLSDFHNLPVSIVKPWLSSSWKDYDIFLKKHGSHMLTSITNGSRINQMSFAAVSDSYSQRDFNIKCCIALAGTTDIGKLNISNCAGFDDSDIKRVSSLTMSETLTVRGGRPDTRAQLINHRTTELIQKFIDEANTTQTPVRYRFTPIWDILQWAFAGVRGDDLIKAVNLEYYYLGYLNYGCDYRESGSLPLQMFNLANNDARMPEYNCSLAPRGCHSDDDCHFKLGRCFCRGKTCVFHQQVTLDTGGKKLEAKANTDSDLRGYGCYFNLQKLKCSCNYPPTQRHVVSSAAESDFEGLMSAGGADDIPKTAAKETERHVVWNGAPKTALFQAHYRMMAAKKNKRKEEL